MGRFSLLRMSLGRPRSGSMILTLREGYHFNLLAGAARQGRSDGRGAPEDAPRHEAFREGAGSELIAEKRFAIFGESFPAGRAGSATMHLTR